jgi:hypothetical protein
MVGLLMVAALQSAAGAKRRETDVVDRLLARQLAAGLMNEILLQAYRDPELGNSALFGAEPGESTGNRSLFDDVDDYNGYTSTPPQDRNGSNIAGYANWTRSVTVAWAKPGTLAETTTPNTDLKKITIAVSKSGKVLATSASYRSNGWVDTIPKPSDATGNHPPVAVATSPGLIKLVTSPVTFDGSGSSDADGDSLSYVWSFGDGTTGAGSRVSKSYSAAGIYTCTLTVYDGHGGMAASSLTVVITPL